MKQEQLQPGYRLVAPTFAGDDVFFSAVFEKVEGDEQLREYEFVKAGSSRALRNRFEKQGEERTGVAAIAVGETGVATLLQPAGPNKRARAVASGNTGTLRQEIQSAAASGLCLIDGDGIKEALYVLADCGSAVQGSYDVKPDVIGAMSGSGGTTNPGGSV